MVVYYVLHVVHASIADLYCVYIIINTLLSLWSLEKHLSTYDENLCPMLVLTFSLNRGLYHWMSILVFQQNMQLSKKGCMPTRWQMLTYMQSLVIYQANVQCSNTKTTKKYIGLTAGKFKMLYRNPVI